MPDDEEASNSIQPSVANSVQDTIPESVPALPTPPSLPPSPQINSKHIRTSETEDGQVLFHGKDGNPIPIPESRKQEYQSLNDAVAAMDKEEQLPPPLGQDVQKDDASSPEQLETGVPDKTPVSNKRDKDTERAYQEGQQKFKALEKEHEQTKQLNQQALAALEVIYKVAEQNPQGFQQLFGNIGQQPHLPSTPEEMEELNNDPAKFNDYVRTLIREEAAKTVYSDPDFVELKQLRINKQQVNGFIQTRFEGNTNHPDLLTAMPYLQRTFAEHQQRKVPITLDQAYDEYLRAKEHFVPAGKVGAAGKVKTNPSNNGSPESSPQARPQSPLPGKYPGVAGRLNDSRAGMQGMTRRQKIEEFGRRILSGQTGSRFSR